MSIFAKMKAKPSEARRGSPASAGEIPQYPATRSTK